MANGISDTQRLDFIINSSLAIEVAQYSHGHSRGYVRIYLSRPTGERDPEFRGRNLRNALDKAIHYSAREMASK